MNQAADENRIRDVWGMRLAVLIDIYIGVCNDQIQKDEKLLFQCWPNECVC